jgi:hypothetical protein
MYFDRPDYDLASARPGSYALTPRDSMIDALRRVYANTQAMIFGDPPAFETILASIVEMEKRSIALRRDANTGSAYFFVGRGGGGTIRIMFLYGTGAPIR